MNCGQAQRCVLSSCARYLFSKMLLESRSRAQTCHRIESGPVGRLLRHSLRLDRLKGGFIAQPPERPLPINQPRVEYEHQAKRRPACLIRPDLVESIRVPEKGMNRGKQ